MTSLLVIAETIVANTQTANTTQTAQGIDWLSYIIPVVAIFVTYILGSLQNRASYKKKQWQLRYDEFYVPYLKTLYNKAMYQNAFSLIADGDKADFIDLAHDNFQHLDLNSQQLFLDFMHAYYGDKEDISKYNQAFNALSDAIASEAKSLSDKLKIPNFSYTYTSRNLPTNEKRLSVSTDKS